MIQLSLRRGICTVLATLLLLTALPVGAFAAQDADSPIDLLDEAELNPVSPRSEALDALLDDIMDDIFAETDEDLDTYGQVKACYDYLVANVRYGSHTANLGAMVNDSVSCRSIYSSYGAVEGFGAVALTARVGMCNAYASAFILMARKIGLDAYLVKGSTRSGGGGYAYHEWAEIKIDDSVYVFDPQLEQNLVAAGLPRYTVFCRTYSEIPGRYSK